MNKWAPFTPQNPTRLPNDHINHSAITKSELHNLIYPVQIGLTPSSLYESLIIVNQLYELLSFTLLNYLRNLDLDKFIIPKYPRPQYNKKIALTLDSKYINSNTFKLIRHMFNPKKIIYTRHFN